MQWKQSFSTVPVTEICNTGKIYTHQSATQATQAFPPIHLYSTPNSHPKRSTSPRSCLTSKQHSTDQPYPESVPSSPCPFLSAPPHPASHPRSPHFYLGGPHPSPGAGRCWQFTPVIGQDLSLPISFSHLSFLLNKRWAGRLSGAPVCQQ